MFIVRHAKRADDSVDSELSTEGIGRSIKLSKLLAEARVTTIVATQRKRTGQTASAARRGAHIALTIVDSSDEDALIQQRDPDFNDHASIRPCARSVWRSSCPSSTWRRLGTTTIRTLSSSCPTIMRRTRLARTGRA